MKETKPRYTSEKLFQFILRFDPFTAHVEADSSSNDGTFRVLPDTATESAIMIAEILRVGLRYIENILEAPSPYRGFKTKKDAQNAAIALEQEARSENAARN